MQTAKQPRSRKEGSRRKPIQSPHPHTLELGASNGGNICVLPPPSTDTHWGVPLRMVTGGTGRGWLVSMGGGQRHPTPKVPSLSPPPPPGRATCEHRQPSSDPRASQQEKGPLLRGAGGRERGSRKQERSFLNHPRPMSPSRRAVLSLLGRALFYTNIFPPRSQPYFPRAPSPCTGLQHPQGREMLLV